MEMKMGLENLNLILVLRHQRDQTDSGTTQDRGMGEAAAAVQHGKAKWKLSKAAVETAKAGAQSW